MSTAESAGAAGVRQRAPGCVARAIRNLLRRTFGVLRSARRALFTVPLESARSPLRPLRSPGARVDDPEALLGRGARRSTLDAQTAGSLSFSGYAAEEVARVTQWVEVYDGAPRAEVLRDVVYLPDAWCLYDRDGRRIETSFLRAGTRLPPLAQPEVSLPRQIQRRDEPLIYAGQLNTGHYGHFLTEGIARLWHSLIDCERRVLTHPLDRFSLRPGPADAFFGAIGLPGERCVAFRQPVLLSEVVVPYPSFVSTPTLRQVFSVHRLMPEAVARALLPPGLETTEQPLYFSRARLPAGRRAVAGEAAFERELREAGFAVAYPEQLSLREQIRLVNRHAVLVGTLGSSLHSLLFDVSARRELVCLGYADSPHPNYLMIDALKRARSHYVAALEEQDGARDFSRDDRTLDVEASRAALRARGLL